MNENECKPRRRMSVVGKVLCASAILANMAVGAVAVRLVDRVTTTPSTLPCYDTAHRDGYSKKLREAYWGDCIERIVQYGSQPGLEIEDNNGTYTAMCPSMETVYATAQFLRDKVPPGRRRATLASIDADKDGEVTDKELTDYIGD